MAGWPAASLLALLAVYIVGRRRLLRLFQVPGLVLLPLLFFLAPSTGSRLRQVGMFLVGFMTIAQFSFWGNYLPRVYPVYLRGTGESFAANVGGRMIGTSAALVTTQLVRSMPGGTLPVQLAYACGARRHDRLRDRVYLELLAAGTEAGKPPR